MDVVGAFVDALIANLEAALCRSEPVGGQALAWSDWLDFLNGAW
ncbi:hypothetical protein [Streptomyces alkaliterrae]|nr:hypothetical protein [Streptomyces alkaliterrae]